MPAIAATTAPAKMATKNGRRVINARRAKGRHQVAITAKNRA